MKIIDSLRTTLKSTAKTIAPGLAERFTMKKFSRGAVSYSQEGEDRVLTRFLPLDTPGLFVDVGAHHPIRFSNTYLYYEHGWRGINIDAMPGSMRLFNRYRSEDTNIEMGIGTRSGSLPFFVFNEPALNSFDESLSRSRENGQYRITQIVDVPVRPLSETLADLLPRHVGRSFLSVDVEGRDLDVLQSNDWRKFRPDFVLAECLGSTLEETLTGEVSNFLREQGYQMVANTSNTAFYRVNDG
jgi:FkbM family methyltransferase